MLKIILLIAITFYWQSFASTFQATFFKDADATLTAAGVPDYLLPSQRFKAEELVIRLRLGGLMKSDWSGLPFHFQISLNAHKIFPADSLMQLALFLFPSPNDMFLPNQALSDPISALDFKTLGSLAAGRDLEAVSAAVFSIDANILHKEMMQNALNQRCDIVCDSMNEETLVFLSDLCTSTTKYTDFAKLLAPNLFKQRGSIAALLTDGLLESVKNKKHSKITDEQKSALLQSFYALVNQARAFSFHYPDHVVEQMFLTFAFSKSKTPQDLVDFYEGIITPSSYSSEASAKNTSITNDLFTHAADMHAEYKNILALPDQAAFFKSASLHQRSLILAASQLFDISYLSVVNMASATYTPTSGKRSAPITFSDCVETAARNYLLALIRRLDSAGNIVYDANLLPTTAKLELKSFVVSHNTFAAQIGADARCEWTTLVSKISKTRYMKPTTNPTETNRACEIRAGHKNVLNIFSHLLGIVFDITPASDEADVLAAYNRICSTFSRDDFQVTCKVCDDEALERHSRISDFFGKLEFQVNGKPFLTFDMQTMHGETKACRGAIAPKFLTDLLVQNSPEDFVILASVNSLVRMVTKENVIAVFEPLSMSHQKEFLMLLPDEADILVPLIDNFNKQLSAYTGSMYHKMLTQRVLELHDDQANQLLFATFNDGVIPDVIKDVVIDYADNICTATDDHSENSFLTKALIHNPSQDWIAEVIERTISINCIDYKGSVNITDTQVAFVDKILDLLPKRRLAFLILNIHSEKQAERFFEWLKNSKLHGLEIGLPIAALQNFVEHIPSSLKLLIMNLDSFAEMVEQDQDITGIAVGRFKPYLTTDAIMQDDTRAIRFALEFCKRHPSVSLNLSCLQEKDSQVRLIEAFVGDKVDYRKLNSDDSALQEAFALAYQKAGIELSDQEFDDATMVLPDTGVVGAVNQARDGEDDEVA